MAIQLADGGDDLAVNHDINVTPFIDVMLVLLIIFMVAAPLATVDTKVDLPASNAAPAPRPEMTVYLTLRENGEMRVGETVVSPEALGKAITDATQGDREQRIFLRADKSVTYEAITNAMNALRTAGYRHVGLVGAEQAGSQ